MTAALGLLSALAALIGMILTGYGAAQAVAGLMSASIDARRAAARLGCGIALGGLAMLALGAWGMFHQGRPKAEARAAQVRTVPVDYQICTTVNPGPIVRQKVEPPFRRQKDVA